MTGNERPTGRLAALPWDEKRHVPVPWFNKMPDGVVDFTGINAHRVLECADKNLCGICGNPLDYWIAFIGGPISAQSHCYTDPPFHRECAEAAILYCPHINRRVHRRTPDEKYDPETSWAPDDGTMEKPDTWIISITRSFKVLPHQGFIMFKAGPVKNYLIYEYGEDGRLHKVQP